MDKVKRFKVSFSVFYVSFFSSDGTTFNDGKSCHRDCNGETKNCYYEFNVQVYDTMTG